MTIVFPVRDKIVEIIHQEIRIYRTVSGTLKLISIGICRVKQGFAIFLIGRKFWF